MCVSVIIVEEDLLGINLKVERDFPPLYWMQLKVYSVGHSTFISISSKSEKKSIDQGNTFLGPRSFYQLRLLAVLSYSFFLIEISPLIFLSLYIVLFSSRALFFSITIYSQDLNVDENKRKKRWYEEGEIEKRKGESNRETRRTIRRMLPLMETTKEPLLGFKTLLPL